jgi:hypothetical protein
MATEYKVLGQAAPGIGVSADLYTVPQGKSAVTSTLSVCNRSSASKNYRVAVRPDGNLLSNVHYVAYDVSLSAFDSIAITIGMALQANTVVTVSGQGELSFSLFGSEID